MTNYLTTNIDVILEGSELVGYTFDFDVDGQKVTISVMIAEHAGATSEETVQNAYAYVQAQLAEVIKSIRAFNSEQVNIEKQQSVPVPLAMFEQEFGVRGVDIDDE